MAFSQAWLDNTSSNVGVFITIGYYNGTSEQTVYLSNRGYTTTDGVSFNPIITGPVSFTESIGIDGSSGLSFNDIEVANDNGALDIWLNPSNFIWVNRSIKIYVGDPSWSSSLANIPTDFGLVFDGTIADIDSRSRNTINFKIRDKNELLNGPVTETKLGTYGTWAGGQNNQDTILPLVFGEVCNIEPLLINPATLQYKFNTGLTERLIEVRDNGVPIYNSSLTGGANVDLTNGNFTLNQKPAGTITCSVQGVRNSVNLATPAADTTYRNNIANIIATIVTQYGKADTRLPLSDLDATNLAAFAAANTQSVGIYIDDTSNVISVCTELAASIGAQVIFSRSGKLQLIRPGSGISATLVTDINDTDIILNTLEISSRTEVISSTKLGYCKNYTVQTGLLTGIPEAHKSLFAKEYLTATASDGGTIKTDYKLTSDPEQINTCLLDGTEASAEATRRNTIFASSRTCYKFTGTRRLLSLFLGQSVTITHNRFNLSSTSAQVISLTPNWTTLTVEVEVLV